MMQTLNKQKLMARMKSRMVAVDASTMNNEMFLYSIGYNNAITAILVEIACGEYDVLTPH